MAGGGGAGGELEVKVDALEALSDLSSARVRDLGEGGWI